MTYIFHNFFYQPIFNLLVFLYNIVPGHDVGIAIILLTIVIKTILLPLSKQSIKSQRAMQDLQPKVDEVKKKYGHNKEEMSKEMMKLYQENKVNPFSSCLPLIIQIPFLFAVFRVFRELGTNTMNLVYPFITKPEVINTMFLGFTDLAKPNLVLAVLAGAAQFWQAKLLITKKPEVKTPGAADENMMAIMNKQMLYIMPIMTIVIGRSLPGGLTLYWLVTTLLTALQQMYIFKDHNKSKIIEGKIVD